MAELRWELSSWLTDGCLLALASHDRGKGGGAGGGGGGEEEGKGGEREEEGEGRERERGRIFAKIIYFKKIKKIFYGLTCGIWQFPGQGARC